jgi:hypothetical protein
VLSRWRKSLAGFIQGVLKGDLEWGGYRLTLMGLVVLAFVVLNYLVEPARSLPAVRSLLENYHLTELLPPPVLDAINFVGGFFTLQAWRHSLPPLAGWLLALVVGSAYLRNLLELESTATAWDYLTAVLFGGPYPRLFVSQGEVRKTSEANPLLRVGGPGWLMVDPGSAVVLESHGLPSNIVLNGRHFVHQFETVREIFDLRERERALTDLAIVTRDGIPLVLDEVRIRFRLATADALSSSLPYPADRDALARACYTPARRVAPTSDGPARESWEAGVCRQVVRMVGRWIANQSMDDLIPPPDREETAPYRRLLNNYLLHREARALFAGMGAEITWTSIGHLRPDPGITADLPGGDVLGQIIDTWKSKHVALAQDEMAEAESYARKLESLAVVQARAQMLMNIVEILRQAREAGVPLDNAVADQLLQQASGVIDTRMAALKIPAVVDTQPAATKPAASSADTKPATPP